MPGRPVPVIHPGRQRGQIPAGQETIHRAAHALFFGPSAEGARVLAGQRGVNPRVLDLKDKVSSHPLGLTDAEAEDVVARVIGRPETGRDVSTLHSEYVGMIVTAADKAAAADIVAEAMCKPLADAGWTAEYNERRSAELLTFDHRPYETSGSPGVITHYLATLRMTPPQKADLDAATHPAGLAVFSLSDNQDVSQAQVTEQLDLLGLVKPELPPDV